MRGESREQAFWARVKVLGPDECWEWTASDNGKGYGYFWFMGRRVTAHRAAFEISHGSIPVAGGYHGMCVCHRCDNRRCCNPSHLFLGTHSDNMLDRQRKGRTRTNPRVKYSASEVDLIRRLYWNSGWTQVEIASVFSISQATVSNLIFRRKESCSVERKERRRRKATFGSHPIGCDCGGRNGSWVRCGEVWTAGSMALRI